MRILNLFRGRRDEPSQTPAERLADRLRPALETAPEAVHKLPASGAVSGKLGFTSMNTAVRGGVVTNDGASAADIAAALGFPCPAPHSRYVPQEASARGFDDVSKHVPDLYTERERNELPLREIVRASQPAALVNPATDKQAWSAWWRRRCRSRSRNAAQALPSLEAAVA